MTIQLTPAVKQRINFGIKPPQLNEGDKVKHTNGKIYEVEIKYQPDEDPNKTYFSLHEIDPPSERYCDVIRSIYRNDKDMISFTEKA